MVCNKCGRQNDDSARFCTRCGAPSLENAPTIPSPVQFTDQAPAAKSPEPSPPSAGRQDAMIGQVIDKRYAIESRLGTGGMGAVYSATRLQIGDAVAIKILRSEMLSDPQAIERFRREARAAARLKHPNVVSVYDFGVTDDAVAYLVMELIEGETLRSLIRRQGKLDVRAVAEIATQVCAALDEAHRQNVIHRDLKPDNIIINRTDRGLKVKVLDFGIAKLRDAPSGDGTLTQPGLVIGTPHYMSPEQCMSQEIDGRSDIYSLGVVLYEMLAGRVPFDAPSLPSVIVQHVTQPPPPLASINPNVTAAVESVVGEALRKQREQRPQTAGELSRKLMTAAFSTTKPGPVAPRQATPWPGSQPTSPQVRAIADTVPASRLGTPPGVKSYQKKSSKVVPVTIIICLLFLLILAGIIWYMQSDDSSSGNKVSRASTNSAADSNTPGNRNMTGPLNTNAGANNNNSDYNPGLLRFVGTWSEKWGNVSNKDWVTIKSGTGGKPLIYVTGDWKVSDEKFDGDVLSFRVKGGNSNWEFLYTIRYSSANRLSLNVFRVHDKQTFTGELYR